MAGVTIPNYQRQVYKQDSDVRVPQNATYSKELLDNPNNVSMQKAGEVANKISEYFARKQKQDDQNLILDYENKLTAFYDNAVYGQDGFLSKKGNNAKDIVDEFNKLPFEYKDEFDSNRTISIPEHLKEKVELSRDKIKNHYLKQVVSYQVQEGQRYNNELFKTNIESKIANSVNNSLNRSIFDKDIKEIIQKQYDGSGKGIVEYKVKEVNDSLATKRIQYLLDVQDIDSAKKELDSVKKHLNDNTFEKLANTIHGATMSVEADNIFENVSTDKDSNGYVSLSKIDEAVKLLDDNKKFTQIEKDKIKSLVVSKANFQNRITEQEKQDRHTTFLNDIAKLIQNKNNNLDEYKAIAISSGITPYEQQENLKYIENIFKQAKPKTDIDVYNYLYDKFVDGTIRRQNIVDEFNNGNLSNSTYNSLLKKYDNEALGSADDFGKGSEIKSMIDDIAKRNKKEDLPEKAIKFNLIQSVMGKSYDESLQILKEKQKGGGFFGWGTPLYKKEILDNKEITLKLNELGFSGEDNYKFISLLQKGYDTEKVDTKFLNNFINQVVGRDKIKDKNSVEYRAIKFLLDNNLLVKESNFELAVEKLKQKEQK